MKERTMDSVQNCDNVLIYDYDACQSSYPGPTLLETEEYFLRLNFILEATTTTILLVGSPL
jgi:hypothetical protein